RSRSELPTVMIWPDIAILGIIGISTVISLLRGFVREVLSLAAWVVAIWVAYTFASSVAPVLESFISLPSARHIAAFVLLLVATLMLMGIINFLLSKIIESTGLTGTDRALGMVFGVLRGIVIVALLVLLAGATPLPQDPWWAESIFVGHFEALAEFALQYLPPGLAKHFSFDIAG
ncbi:MAG: CvpA family protein, partial [Gammaproteobacteria bacterium]